MGSTQIDLVHASDLLLEVQEELKDISEMLNKGIGELD